ncbi:hypothetical protein COO60DRAFT_1704488 [Scenedesmus sp. NREL 46B-D3]|nr:hypothetical protein COO60DRAFT_1704488 [Scenedesmus sp. NREL 46B-D3]
MTCTSNIQQRGVLPLGKAWTEAGRVTRSVVPLEQGTCVGYQITPAELAGTACATSSPDSYILVEFWQQPSSNSSSSSSSGGSSSSRSSAPDVRVLAARGIQPWMVVGPDGHTKVTPPIRDPDTGLTPVGTFVDDAAVVYNRAAARVFIPTASPMTDAGEPLDPDTWYITIAVKPQESSSGALPGYGIRASCLVPGPSGDSSGSRSSSRLDTRSIGSGSSGAAAAAAAAALGDTTEGVPCPVATPGGPQCSGRGTCRVNPMAQTIDRSRYCECESGSGHYACQQRLEALPLNTATTVTVEPGQWGIWEVTLPRVQDSNGLGVLLVAAERVDREDGFGGNPLLFLKPFMTKDHNEPSLDALDTDVVQYADLRSFQLQLNRHYLLQRLPVRDAMTPTGTVGYSMPRRWYVAIYNSNATRLSQPVRVVLDVQYRDLNRSPLVCPFNCSGSGRCVDPKPASSALMPLDLGTGGPSDASVVTAIGPMQDQSPVDAGFMCVCGPGHAGLTCEGRVQNVTVGSGEQRLGPEVLQPGDWFFYVVTVDAGFNPQAHDLGIQWTIGEPSSPPSNYSGAFISFDQGPLPSHALGDRRLVIPVRKSMTPYSKLLVRHNSPLPLQVPGGQLSASGTYVVSILNNDYAVSEPFQFTLKFFVMTDQGSFLHPYMSILLGVTAAVVLCLAMTLCKRVVMRYGIVPWRWRQRRRELAEAAAAGASGSPGRGNSLALVLMAQAQPSNMGVPREIYQAFPCRPYAAKEYQQRQHGVQQQQQDAPATAGADQQPRRPRHCGGGQPASPLAASAVSPAAAAAPDATGADVESQPQQQQGSGRIGGDAPAAAGRQTFAARLSQLGSQLSQQLSMQLGGTAPAPAAAAAAGGGAAAAAQQLRPACAAVPPAAVKASGAGGAAGTGSTGGTAASQDNNLAAVRDDDAPSCTVCLGEYAAGELVRQLPCGHEFHQACIDQWMANHGTCPICRMPLWPGAYEPQEEESDGGSDSDPPPAIYVHHGLPGGFMGGSSTGGRSGGAPAAAAAGAAPRAAAGGGAAAGAGLGARGGGAAAAADAGANMAVFGVNEQQPQRLRWQQQQQQQWLHLQPMSSLLSTGAAAYRDDQAQEQRQRQLRQQRSSVGGDGSDWRNGAAVQGLPGTSRRQQQRPRHSVA